jgi:20S proteasome subunit alpha 5
MSFRILACIAVLASFDEIPLDSLSFETFLTVFFFFLKVDSHIGAAMSGLVADARTLIDHARVEAQNHRFTYDEAISVESVSQSVCDLSLKFGEDRGKNQETLMSRPFGVALLLAGIDENGPHLFHTDPSGTYTEWTAKAIGAGDQGAQTMLQETWSKGITLVEAETLALTTLKEVMEETLSDSNVEIASVTYGPDGKTGVFRVYTKEQLAPIVARLPAATFAE